MEAQKFKISDHEYFLVHFEAIPVSDHYCCGNHKDLHIDYIDDKNNITVPSGEKFFPHFFEMIEEDNGTINKLLRNDLVYEGLDLGYCSNQYWQDIPGFDYDGCYYFCSGEKHNTWMYNDKDGNMIIEISPTYYFNEEDKDKPDYLTYEKFIKDYKVTVRTKIDRDCIMQWKGQSKAIKEHYGISEA